MSKPTYQPLTSKQFRLITLFPGTELTPIKTTLRHVSIEEKPKFDALSYEWGPESPNDPQIYVDNKPFTIRRNLCLFLKRLRASSPSESRILYADAICINQQDGEEKNRQVALMSEIYMRAKKVLVWLGEHDPNSRMVFGTGFQDYVDTMPRWVVQLPCLLPVTLPFHIGKGVKRTARRMQSGTDPRVSAWTALLSRSYFNRTWIVQEFLLARSVVVYCGQDHMDGDLLFTKPLQDWFSRIIQKNKGGLEGIPRSFLLYFWKTNQKRHGTFGKGKPYFPGTDIFELAFNFQHTECQDILDHVFGLLALEDPSKSAPIIPNYDDSAQTLFIKICMSKLPELTGRIDKVTDDGVVRVAMLFQGLRLTFDDAEKILDILLEIDSKNLQTATVVATIAKSFDGYGLLKPERKEAILPGTKTPPTSEQIISITKQWQTAQKKNGNWYNIHPTTQIHDPPGMGYLEFDEPLWSRYSTLRAATADAARAAQGAQNINNINTINHRHMHHMNHTSHMNHMNNINLMNLNLNNMALDNLNIMQMNNAAMMGNPGMMAGGPGMGGGGA